MWRLHLHCWLGPHKWRGQLPTHTASKSHRCTAHTWTPRSYLMQPLLWLAYFCSFSKGFLKMCGDRASLVAQLVKKQPAMQEMWVWSLGWKDPLEKGKAIPFWPAEFHGCPWGCQELDMTEQLSLSGTSQVTLEGICDTIIWKLEKWSKGKEIEIKFVSGKTNKETIL